jgi:hypothetical protein
MPKKILQPPRSKKFVTTADLLAGATLPMKVTLNVTLEPGLTDKIAGEDPECVHRGGPDIESRLAQYTPALMKWAARSSDNAKLLITQPLAALDKSGAKVSAGDRAALEAHLRSVTPTEVLPAGIELVAANVNIAKGRKS